MAREEQLRRTWRLLDLLDAHPEGLTVGDIAAELGISVRTVYRDMEALEASDFPLCSERVAREVQWKFVEGYRFRRQLPFAAHEVIAIALGHDLLRSMGDAWFTQASAAAVRKVEACLSPEARAYLDVTRSAFAARGLAGRDYGPHAGVLHLLIDGIRERRRLLMIYDSRSARTTTWRQIDPYVLFLHDGCLYLAGHDERRGEVRTFAVHRIRSLQPSGERFARPKDFTLDAYLAGSFRLLRGDGNHDVRVALSGDAAAYEADRRWHASQRQHKLPDGRVELQFALNHFDEVKSWVLGFGGEAEALAPAALRSAVIEGAMAVLRAHGVLEGGDRKAPMRAARTSRGRRRSSDRS